MRSVTDKRRSVAEFLDATWETRARSTLESVGREPDRGVRAAQDALRLVAGEITEDEFHALHHGPYLDEFGVDERPLATLDPEAPRAAGEAEAMQSSAPSSSRDGAADDRSVRWGMVIDLERCTGCLACVDACHTENGLSIGVHWMHVIPFSDENREDVNFLVRPCMHCSNAPCVKVCPVAARHVRQSDGLVLTDYDVCIGCRYCEVACPYGVNYFQWAEPSSYGGADFSSGDRRDIRGRQVVGNPPRGVIGKCTFCPQRVDEADRRGTAACALACPHDAIHIGDLNDPQSDPRRYLERRRQENPNLSTFRLLDELGTEPNVIYIGQEPSERAEPAQGPTTFEDWGFVEDRRAVLQDSTPWFRQAVRRG